MSTDMEVVIDFEYLKGRQNETAKEPSLAANFSETFRFESPYTIMPHGSEENGLSCDDGHSIPQIDHGRKRGGGGIRSPPRLWRFKMQISLRIIGAPDSQSARLIVLRLNLLNINTVAACLVTDLLTSVVQLKPGIRSTIG